MIKLKYLILAVILFLGKIPFAQKVISLEKAIELAQQHSIVAQKAQLELQHSRMRYELLRKNRLPLIKLSSVVPSFSKATSKITIPSGEDIFVEQNQLFNDLSLSITQKEPLLNGHFLIRSSINRLDILGNHSSVNYFSTPISIGYINDNLFFNEDKWEEKLVLKDIQLQSLLYNESLEKVATKTVEIYFELFETTKHIEEKTYFLNQLKSFISILEKRLELGNIDKTEILETKIELLELENELQHKSLYKKSVKKQLSNMIKLNTADFKIDMENQNFPDLVLSDIEFMKELLKQKASFASFEKKSLEIDKKLDEIKRKDLLTFSFNSFLGFSNTGNKFRESIFNLSDQQAYTLSLQVTLFDFGRRKQKMELAKLEKQIEVSTLGEADEADVAELETLLYNIKSQQEIYQLLKKTKYLYEENYKMLVKRFNIGKINFFELNLAQKKIMTIEAKITSSIKKIWIDYYKLRAITMYDFFTNENIKYK